jgi:hypothetical protein
MTTVDSPSATMPSIECRDISHALTCTSTCPHCCSPIRAAMAACPAHTACCPGCRHHRALLHSHQPLGPAVPSHGNDPLTRAWSSLSGGAALGRGTDRTAGTRGEDDAAALAVDDTRVLDRRGHLPLGPLPATHRRRDVTFGSTFFRKYCEPVCGCIHGLASSVLVGGADGDAHTCEGRRAHVVRERTRMPEMSTHASPSHETMQCRNTGEPRRKCTAASLPPAHAHAHTHARTRTHTQTHARVRVRAHVRVCAARAHACMRRRTDRLCV